MNAYLLKHNTFYAKNLISCDLFPQLFVAFKHKQTDRRVVYAVFFSAWRRRRSRERFPPRVMTRLSILSQFYALQQTLVETFKRDPNLAASLLVRIVRSLQIRPTDSRSLFVCRPPQKWPERFSVGRPGFLESRSCPGSNSVADLIPCEKGHVFWQQYQWSCGYS